MSKAVTRCAVRCASSHAAFGLPSTLRTTRSDPRRVTLGRYFGCLRGRTSALLEARFVFCPTVWVRPQQPMSVSLTRFLMPHVCTVLDLTRYRPPSLFSGSFGTATAANERLFCYIRIGALFDAHAFSRTERTRFDQTPVD